MAAAPPGRVLTAFGLRGRDVRPLRGGRAWSGGGTVLKPVDDEAEALWVADVLTVLVEDGFRINRPVCSAAGTWVVEGWSAWTALAGEHDTSGRWTDVLRVGERLGAALAGLARPAFLDERVHAWAVADRVAWGEEPWEPAHEVLHPLVEGLVAHLRPVAGPGQVIHGDLTGNVLFAAGRSPGVIDFTPYWRPAEFCQAVVVVDALLWHRAPAELLDALPSTGDRRSLAARAALFRLVASDRLAAGRQAGERRSYLRSVTRDHGRVLALLDAWRA